MKGNEMSLAKRIEVRINGERLNLLEEEATRRRKSVSKLIREAIDAKYPVRDSRIAGKLAAVEELGRIDAPIATWQQMEGEITKGILE